MRQATSEHNPPVATTEFTQGEAPNAEVTAAELTQVESPVESPAPAFEIAQVEPPVELTQVEWPVGQAPVGSKPLVVRELRRCFPKLPVWENAPVASLLDQAAVFFEAEDIHGALACAEEAARQAPTSVEAHHDRAAALIRLNRLEEARDAATLMLALAPEDPEALEFAAELYINQLEPSAERTRIGLAYARRAIRLLRANGRFGGRRGASEIARLFLLEAQSLIDLGRARDALAVLSRVPPGVDTIGIRYQRAVARFELGQFQQARVELEALLADDPDHASGHYHLGLVLERDPATAARADEHFARAAALEPETFSLPLAISPQDFAEQVRDAVARLPAHLRATLKAHGVRIEWADLPDAVDLNAEAPPLSPTILGLFRGLPIGRDDEAAEVAIVGRATRMRGQLTVQRIARAGGGDDAARVSRKTRTIILFRRNLLRSVRSKVELQAAIERTLLHEIGHVQGEDDASLRDRGLE